jgi:inorganic pyrophosphatase
MKLPKAFAKNKNVNVIIETPFKSRNKFSFDPDTGMYKLKKAIPDGQAFPCDFGFIPRTLGDDGDPLDVMLLMDDYTFPGCLVESRIIGVIKVEEKKGKKKLRNDRFIAVPVETKDDDHINHINDINKNRLKSITAFLEFYNVFAKKEVKVLGIVGPQEAIKLIKKQLT